MTVSKDQEPYGENDGLEVQRGTEGRDAVSGWTVGLCEQLTGERVSPWDSSGPGGRAAPPWAARGRRGGLPEPRRGHKCPLLAPVTRGTGKRR